METFFEIYGTPIPVSSIKDFRIIQREFIYRPVYTEAEKSIINALTRKKYVFSKMQPYAAIIDEKGHKSSMSEYKAKNFKESVGKDLVEGAVAAVADKFNIKTLKYKKYVCINQAGRTFTTYLEDIPALLMTADGKFSDVHKNDELYPLLGEPIAPAINIVHALEINAKDRNYIFYGNGIQLEDIGAEYERLKLAYSEYHTTHKTEKGNKMLGTLAKLPFSKLGKKSDDALMIEEKSEE